VVTQFLAQLAHVALNHVLVETRVEETVNGVKELGFCEPFSLMPDQMLKNAQFATRQGQCPAADFGILAVKENAYQAGRPFA
jgi:hypothetical protein